MPYNHVVEMAYSQSLLERVAACAAAEGIEGPREWALANAWRIVAHDPVWEEVWEYNRTTAATPNVNPDTGYRTDVIADDKIAAVVAALKPPEEPPAEPVAE